MPRPRNHVPAYRLHKQSGQAIVTVTVNGKRRDILLGKHGSPESQEEYARVLARLRAGGPSAAVELSTKSDITISELVLAYATRDQSRRCQHEGQRPGGTS